LKAIIINPAQIWGVGNELARLEKGKWATLVIYRRRSSRNPEPGSSTSYIKGKEVELSNKQTRLYEKYVAR